MMATAPTKRFCSICVKQVSLENCKVDEEGLPVHELCYVSKVAHTAPHRRTRRASVRPVNTTPAWEQNYNAAILETDDAKLPLRLTEAMAAIDARLCAILSDELSPNELQAIHLALAG